MKDHIGYQMECELVVRGECSGIESGFFFGGIGIEVAPYTFNFVDDLACREVMCSFEDGMFDEVSDTVFFRVLVACTCSDH